MSTARWARQLRRLACQRHGGQFLRPRLERAFFQRRLARSSGTAGGAAPPKPPSAAQPQKSPEPPTPTVASAGASRPKAAASPITWLSLGLSAVAGAALYVYYESEKEQKLQQAVSQQRVVGKAALGGPFTLVDMHGRPVTDKDFLGKYLLLYFGFSRCPDICPSELVKMGKVLDRLGLDAEKFQALYISVDPNRDSLLQLEHYAKDFHPGILFLTGTPAQCDAAAKVYRVYHSKADDVDEDEYLVDHSIVIYLVGPDGDFLDFFTQRMTESDIYIKAKELLRDA